PASRTAGCSSARPHALVRPGREGPRYIAIPSPFPPPSTGGRALDAKQRLARLSVEPKDSVGPASADGDHAPMPDDAQGCLPSASPLGHVRREVRCGSSTAV